MLEYTIFTLSAMGGPSPLWEKYTPLFHSQNNTRSILRGEVSAVMSTDSVVPTEESGPIIKPS
jgi:hypothetical protein